MTKSTCSLPTEVYSRVVGYFRPVQQWNAGKQAEFRERRPYCVGRGGEQRVRDVDVSRSAKDHAH